MFELVSTSLLGLPVVAWGGITVLTLLTIQILIGTRVLKVDFKYHKYLAWALLAFALVHTTAAFIFIVGK